MSAPRQSLQDVIDGLRERDPRFAREAYAFVVAAILHAVERQPEARSADPERRHLDGREVVRAVVELARAEFGPLAATVLVEWGVTASRHIGEIVFQLVERGQLSARADDRIEDFLAGPELLSAVAAGAPAAGREPGRS